MARYSATLRDNYNRPVDGALVTVTVSSTDALASLTADDGSFLPNPFTSGPLGAVVFNANGDFYDIAYRDGGRLIRTDFNVNVGGASSLPPGSVINSLAPGSTVNAPSQAAVIAGIAAASAFTQTGAGAITNTIDAKLKQPLQTVRDRGADNTGVADCRAAFVACDALGAFTVPPGLYLINSNLTITNRVIFSPGARIAIPAGVTVTFNGGIDAPEAQIFNITGTGAVAGLSRSLVAWFSGDLLNTATNADAAIQKAYDACILPVVVQDPRAVVEWPVGYFSSNGAGINVVKGQHTIGKGKNSSVLLHLTAVTNGLICSAVEGPIVEGMGFFIQSPNVIATSGVQVWFQAGAVNGYVKDCYFGGGYIAKRWTGVNGGKSENVDVINTMGSVDYIDGSAAIVVTGGNNSAFSDFVDLSTTTGFIPGESLTWTGGTGLYGYTTSGTRAKIIINDVHPPIGGTIHGATSGTNATCSAIYVGNALGALRIYGNSAAFIIRDNEYSGGSYAWITDSTTNSHGSRPEYGVVSGNYFDHTDNGCSLNNLSGTTVSDNWFSSRQSDGCTLLVTTHCDFSGNLFASSWFNGLLISGNSVGTRARGGFVAGNNRSNAGKSGIYVLANTTDFTIIGVRIGGQTAAGFDGTQTFPVVVEAGTSTRYIIRDNLINGNATNSISDGGTGTKSVGDNL